MAVDGVEIIFYPTWIYIEDYAIEGMEKEVQPDLNKTYKLALQFLSEKKEELRIGVQPSYLTPYAGQFLTDTFKEKNLVDIKQLLIEARAIKTPWEIEVLREAARYSELTMNKDLFPQPRRERDSSSAVIYRNLPIIFKMI